MGGGGGGGVVGERGSGIRSIQHMNHAFMAKLAWRLLSESNTLWARVLLSKCVRGTPG